MIGIDKTMRRVRHGRGVSSYVIRIDYGYKVAFDAVIGDDGMHAYAMRTDMTSWAEAKAYFDSELARYAAR
jgi:hypothetical protein